MQKSSVLIWRLDFVFPFAIHEIFLTPISLSRENEETVKRSISHVLEKNI
jgi:hypothetical protein